MAEVEQWWNNKANEILELMPNFGGYVVKADSEGEPGPHTYNRTEADGANMMARSMGKNENGTG